MIDNCTTNYLVIVLVVQFFSVLKQIEMFSQNKDVCDNAFGSVYKKMIKMHINSILSKITIDLFVNHGTIKVKC